MFGKFRKQENVAAGTAAGNPKTRPLRYYNVLMTVTILVAFLILGLVYSKIIYDAISADKLALMNRTADNLLVYNELEKEFGLDGEVSEATELNLQEASSISRTMIWLVRPDGELYYNSFITSSATGSLTIHRNGKYYLPDSYTAITVPREGLTFTGGNFMGVFQDGSGNWVSIVRPIRNSSGEMIGTLQLHNRMAIVEEAQYSVVFGFLIVLFLAVLIAIAVIKIYARRMSKPIELLSSAANLVAKGDLSTRVDYSAYETEGPYNSGLPEDDLVNLMQTFNRMIEQIERQNREQSDFIASISHDLRTPLTSISGFVTAILDGTIPPERREHYLKIVQDESKRLTSLVSDMNSAILLDTQNRPTDFQKFDIYELIERVLASQEVLLKEKNISVQTDLAHVEGQKIFVLGEEEQIERVLYNLISNAVKFIDQDGIIAISAKKQSSALLIVEVEDNGPGIAEEDLPHVFDRFFKSDRARTDRKGSGLGLYICKRILANHGQNIFAGKSSLGGAKFEFTLPLA